MSIALTYEIDDVDLGLLGRLSREGRTSWAELALEFGLTAPAIATRVKRLVERGVIRQFTACVAPMAVGAVTAFVQATLEDPAGHDAFRVLVGRLVAVQECHRIAGSAQYLLKIRARSLEELDNLLSSVLPSATRGSTLHVSMVMSTLKESAVFPLPKTMPPGGSRALE